MDYDEAKALVLRKLHMPEKAFVERLNSMAGIESWLDWELPSLRLKIVVRVTRTKLPAFREALKRHGYGSRHRVLSEGWIWSSRRVRFCIYFRGKGCTVALA